MRYSRSSLCAIILAATASQAIPQNPVSPQNSLVLAVGGEPETGFDPMLGWGNYGNPLFQSTLLKRDVDLAIQPDLATDWVLSKDRLIWTITIREGAFFSDGTPVTAQDVAFSFTTAKAAPGAVDLSVMAKAEAVDDHTLRLTLKQPWITFAEAFFTLGIVPRASYGPGYGRAPVGSGPFQMLSWTEGEQLIVVPNDHYYGEASAFEQITFLFAGADAGLAAAMAGVADLVSVPAAMAAARPDNFYALPVKTVDNRGLSLPFLPPHTVEGRKIGNAVTADPAIRLAMNLGIDRDLMVEVALHGFGAPAFGPVDGLPWAGEHDHLNFDPAAATALLDQAGWLPGPDGIRVKDGIQAAFPIHYPASDPSRQAVAEVLAEMLRPLGIKATPTGGSWDAIGRVMASEPVVFGYGSHSPHQLYSLYAGQLAGVEYMNPSYYANPQVDALFQQAQAAPDIEASYPFWSQAAHHYGVKGDNAWLWLANLDHVYLVRDCLDLGRTQIEPHGHGWPITTTISQWRRTCE